MRGKITRASTKSSPDYHSKQILIIALLSAASSLVATVLYGFNYGVGNNEFHIAIVDRVVTGHWYHGDIMSATMKTYYSAFWYLAAFCVKLTGRAEAVFFIFYMIARMLFCAGVSLVIRALAPRTPALLPWITGAIAALAPGFLSGLSLGADPTFGNYLSQTFLSLGPCLAATAWGIERRYMLSSIGLGAAFYINPMQAFFALPLVSIIAAWDLRSGLLALPRLLKSAGLFCCIVLPVIAWIVWGLSQFTGTIEFEGSALMDFAKYCYPDHYFWSVKSLSDMIDGLAIPGTLVFLSGCYRMVGGQPFERSTVRALILASIVAFGFIVAGIFLPMFLPTRAVLSLNLFRSDALFYPLVVAATCALALRKNTLVIVPTLAALAALILRHNSIALVIVAGAFAGVAGKEWIKTLRKTTVAFIATVLLTSIALLVYDVEETISPPLRWGIVLAFVATGSICWWAVGSRVKWAAPLGYVAFCGLLGYSALEYRVLSGARPSDRQKRVEEIRWLARHVSQQVPVSSLFVIPPNYSIRPFLRRGVYLAMKDGSAYLWHDGVESEVVRRLGVLGITYTPGLRHNSAEVEKQFQDSLEVSLNRCKQEGVTHAILPLSSLKNSFGHWLARSDQFVAMNIDDAIAATHGASP